MPKILIAPTTFSLYDEKPIDLLKKNGYTLIKNEYGQKLSKTQLIDLCQNCIGVLAGTEIYSKDVINQLPALRVISRLGIGMDNIDLEMAKKKGIIINKTMTTPASSVAELALGVMIDLARKISISNYSLKKNEWKKEMGLLLEGKTLGIMGLGTIGKKLVELVKGFNFEILAFDKNRDNNYAKEYKIKYCSIETLFNQSDIISIHLNLTDKTKYIINEKNIKLMKSNVILINTSRGEIIDENEIYKALLKNKIGALGMDVFSHEPYSGPLTKLDNVILTPHIGSYAKESRIQMEIEAVDNLIKALHEG